MPAIAISEPAVCRKKWKVKSSKTDDSLPALCLSWRAAALTAGLIKATCETLTLSVA